MARPTETSPSRAARRRVAVAALGLAALGAAAAGWLFWPGAGNRADADDPAQVALGESVYRAHCARCHGARLEGEADWRTRRPDGKLPAPPHDATGHSWHHSDAQLFRITKHGPKPPAAPDGYRSDMPAYDGTLSDAQIWAVLAYIKSRWPAEIRARHQALEERARQ